MFWVLLSFEYTQGWRHYSISGHASCDYLPHLYLIRISLVSIHSLQKEMSVSASPTIPLYLIEYSNEIPLNPADFTPSHSPYISYHWAWPSESTCITYWETKPMALCRALLKVLIYPFFLVPLYPPLLRHDLTRWLWATSTLLHILPSASAPSPSGLL